MARQAIAAAGPRGGKRRSAPPTVWWADKAAITPGRPISAARALLAARTKRATPCPRRRGVVDRLPLVDPAGPAPAQASPRATAPPSPLPQGTEAVLAAVEGLAALHRKGIRTGQEFAAKKAAFLASL